MAEGPHGLDAWNKSDLSGEDAVRLILDGIVIRVRLDRKPQRFAVDPVRRAPGQAEGALGHQEHGLSWSKIHSAQPKEWPAEEGKAGRMARHP